MAITCKPGYHPELREGDWVCVPDYPDDAPIITIREEGEEDIENPGNEEE